MNKTSATLLSSALLLGTLSALAYAGPVSVFPSLAECKGACATSALSMRAANKAKAVDQDDDDSDMDMSDMDNMDQGADVNIGSGKVIGSFRDNSGKVGAGNVYIGPGTKPCKKAAQNGNTILPDKNDGSVGSGKVTLGDNCDMGTGNVIGGNDNRGSVGSGNVTIGE